MPEATLGSVETETPAAAPQVVTMADTIGETAHNLPTSLAKVAGYVTGSTNVRWSASDWGRFPHAGHVRVNQDPTSDPFEGYVLDVENLAWTNTTAAAALRHRLAAGRGASVYTNAANVTALTQACKAQGIASKEVSLWVANWNLSEAQAQAAIGTDPYFDLVAVQWASPSSNPDTILPGTSLTLSQANADLSVALASWFAPDPPPTSLAGLVVTQSLATHPVKSVDGGKTWTVS